MDTASIEPSSAWAGLPPELLFLATVTKGNGARTDAAKLNVADAFQRLQELREQIEEAMERAKEAQESAGLWGDISGVFGGDIATIAGVVASAALVVGTAGAGAAVVVAALAVGFTAGGEIAEECGLDPKIVMAFKLAGASMGLLGGNAASASQCWSSVYTVAKAAEGGALVVGGTAHAVEGQYRGDAADQQAQATYFRKEEQLESQLTDEQIAKIREHVEQLSFLTQAATTINAQRGETEQSVIQRIGG